RSVVVANGSVRMLLAEEFAAQVKGFLKQRLCLGVLSLGVQVECQAIETRGRDRMRLADHSQRQCQKHATNWCGGHGNPLRLHFVCFCGSNCRTIPAGSFLSGKCRSLLQLYTVPSC